MNTPSLSIFGGKGAEALECAFRLKSLPENNISCSLNETMITESGNKLNIKCQYSFKSERFDLSISEGTSYTVKWLGELTIDTRSPSILLFISKLGQKYQLNFDFSEYSYYDN